MKVAIISIVNIKHMTLISLFTDILEKKGIKYDLIYIDKYHINEKNNADNTFKYEIDISKSDSKIKKIVKYFGFRGFVKKVIKNQNYDLVIIWKSETGYLLFNFLKRYFKYKYIYNIRDYAGENNPIIKIIQRKLVRNSRMTTISSKRFLNFLPKGEYKFVNSINPKFMASLEVKNSIKKNGPINICFIGYVRFLDNDKKLLMALKNDKRFVVQYFGAGAALLEKFSYNNNISNVSFIDSFDSTETVNLLQGADIINNLYGNHNTALDTAVSIKYYYSLLLKIPIMVWENTYMEEITQNIGNSFVFNGDYENLGDRLYSWYEKIDWNLFNNKLNQAVLTINHENIEFKKSINEILDGSKVEL